MPDASDHRNGTQPPGGFFATTHWSVFNELRQEDPARSAAALTALCRSYWTPVFAFLQRQRGASKHEAEDLTQAFFQHLLKYETLSRAVRKRGRFRSFLLAALKYFLANERDKEQSIRRGGRFDFVSLDDSVAQGFGDELPTQAAVPEAVFDRQWAVALVRQTLDRLRRDYEEAGNIGIFRLLEPALTDADTQGLYAACAEQLRISEGSARVALCRLRRRFGELLRSEVAQTVARPEEVDEELRYLLAALVA
jgi:hypothetical protein